MGSQAVYGSLSLVLNNPLKGRYLYFSNSFGKPLDSGVLPNEMLLYIPDFSLVFVYV